MSAADSSGAGLRAVLSMGSNMDDPQAHLQSVVAAARQEGLLQAVSRVYSTPPWGEVEQEDFLNAVLIIEHPGSPQDVLAWAQQRESEAGRTREVRWGPRTLDVDVIALTETILSSPTLNSAAPDHEVRCDTAQLTVPHPRAAERAFVLVPWAEIEPDACLGGRPIAELVAELDPTEVEAVREVGSVLRTGEFREDAQPQETQQ